MTQFTTEEYLQILQKQFHFAQFRPGQLEAISTVMSQNRLLCIQPTGYGKSLLYQLPAVLLQGITLVISPLLALMRDQIQQLNQRFNIPAASINSDQTEQENITTHNKSLNGKINILFVAPEQLENINRIDFLLRLPIKLIVIDEAHCISTWGHDFRPSYRNIIQLVQAVAKVNSELKLLALTATANKKTEIDIKQQLQIDNQAITVFRESMNRPNIRLSILHITGIAEKLAKIFQLINSLDGSGLIYCATRENTEIVAAYLATQNISSIAYHAGIDPLLKQSIQSNFIADKYKVIAATNALGMGIDKSNLRFVIHFDMPGSITAYYQEVGRIGRDGLPSDGILLYDPADSRIQSYFIDSAQPSAQDFNLVLNTIITSKIHLNLSHLKRLTGLHPTRINVILAELIEQGFLTKTLENRLQVYLFTKKLSNPDLSRYQIQLEVKTHELQQMQKYAKNSKTCLMTILRLTLGDSSSTNCGQCCVCTNTSTKVPIEKDFVTSIASWLERRTVPITLSRKIKDTACGIAALDGKLRSHLFIQFMRERTQSDFVISHELSQLIQECLNDLEKNYRFGCIIPLPSRTWATREKIIRLLASHLNTPVLDSFLHWNETPAARQGELLNNDQRQFNVTDRMLIQQSSAIPPGAILLVDDYIGSGATLNEAARTLREHANIHNEIVPFTIAAVKWRIGKQGMI